MTSERKRDANRANAKASTGPRTAAGKARAAGNARRYGLTVSVKQDPLWGSNIEPLARRIVGDDGGDPELLEMARRIAEAQIHLARIRNIRHELIEQSFASRSFRPRTSQERNLDLTAARRFIRKWAPLVEARPVYRRRFYEYRNIVVALVNEPTRHGDVKRAAIYADATMSERLSALDGYERKALSRRKFAIRDFDELRKRKASACLGA